MRRIIGFGLILLICAIVAYAFAPRPPVQKPATVQRFDRVMINDAKRVGDRIVAIGDAGRIFVSDDEGDTWRHVDSGTRSTLTRLRALDEKTLIAVGHDAIILKTDNAGDTWTELYSAPDAESPLMDVLALDEQRMVAIGAYHQYLQSLDGGANWEPVQVSDDDKHFNAIARMGKDGLLLLGEAGTVLYSKDLGKTWGKVPTPYAGSYFGAVVIDDKTAIVFGMRGNLFRFTVGGKGLEKLDNDSKASLLGGEMADDAVVLVGQDGTALVSKDKGMTFNRQRTSGSRIHTAVMKRKDGQWLAVGEQGAVVFKLAEAAPSEGVKQ